MTPKSGITWLKINPHDLVPFLELKLYVDGQVLDFSSFTPPRILSTHLPYDHCQNQSKIQEPNLFTNVGI
ncbi:hypothetical protein H5410_027521 [Solanum commersonii]|uniref:Uncharacterized protein n=1 Tax=Solanum commersonii TaxID=4109 RepID=A0A9J5Z1H3_SOLCO|nr:hypothetical protein H5410_027521 [Solanum commersonii]